MTLSSRSCKMIELAAFPSLGAEPAVLGFKRKSMNLHYTSLSFELPFSLSHIRGASIFIAEATAPAP